MTILKRDSLFMSLQIARLRWSKELIIVSQIVMKLCNLSSIYPVLLWLDDYLRVDVMVSASICGVNSGILLILDIR